MTSVPSSNEFVMSLPLREIVRDSFCFTWTWLSVFRSAIARLPRRLIKSFLLSFFISSSLFSFFFSPFFPPMKLRGSVLKIIDQTENASPRGHVPAVYHVRTEWHVSQTKTRLRGQPNNRQPLPFAFYRTTARSFNDWCTATIHVD